jgi:hypothetical protein
MFYQAMIIFAGKHFTSRKARTFRILIYLAIYFRAALSMLRRFMKQVYRPVLDGVLIFLGYLLALPFWEQVRFNQPGYYPLVFLEVVVPAYILVWIIAIYYSGGYDNPTKLFSLLKGHLIGTLVILVIYALLPIEWRFSRALIFLGSGWAILSTLGMRILGHLVKIRDYEIDLNRQKRMVIVGKENEARRVSLLLKETQAKPHILGFVSPDREEQGESYMGSIDQIDDISAIHKVDEIVFCSRDLPSQAIIRIMTRLIGTSVDFKIAPPESLSIIGSNSINTAGDLYTIHFNSIGKNSNRRNKRLFDLLTALALLVTFPLWFLFVRGRLRSVGRTIQVLLGLKTWVGYAKDAGMDPGSLPALKNGILNPASHLTPEMLDPGRINEINLLYAKDYRMVNDLQILTRNFRKI